MSRTKTRNGPGTESTRLGGLAANRPGGRKSNKPFSWLSVSLLFVVLLLRTITAAGALTLDQTSVGRFGAGHRITAATANQDLPVWNTVNIGQQIETRLYDPDGKTVSLGRCGLPLDPGTPIQNSVREIGWTQLISRYTASDATLDVQESLLTPALWFRSNRPRLALFQPDPKSKEPAPITESLAFPLRTGIRLVSKEGGLSYNRARDGRLISPWFLALVRQGAFRFPVLCLLYNCPESISRLAAGGLLVRWPAGQTASSLGILPLDGCRPASLERTQGWERGLPPGVVARSNALANWFLPIPTGLKETYRLTEKNVCITNTIIFANQTDEWGIVRKSKGYSPVPAAIANAIQYGYPAHLLQTTTDLHYPTYLGPFCAAAGTRTLTCLLPRPRLYETLSSPFDDPGLQTLLPEPVTQTIQDYSRYVTTAYQNKPVEMYEHSAIGAGRTLGSEYPCLRLMNPQARKTFTVWADRAVKQLYDWKDNYGYGEEKANGRRFFLDNYRIGGKDYIDAGWFGYDIIAMWARSHYGAHWEEVRQNWPRIRELFYGWNWIYNDYAAMYAPLYVDGESGGNPKGYTDNMGMLPALYAWARMADHLSDRQTRDDALYLLARDRIARYNRMAIHDYTRKCGFRTDVNVFTSDMGNGPNIAPSGRFIAPNPVQWNTGSITDYGDYAAGLWFLSGSFFEPTTNETLDLMRAGTMLPRVTASLQLLDRRFPRWWANPPGGEMANYQILARGALLHEDPIRLRYYFDYQDGLQQGIWLAEPWHADAFAGIVLSRFYPVQFAGDNNFVYRDGARWRPVRAEAECHWLLGKDNRRYLVLWNAASKNLQTRLRWKRLSSSAYDAAALVDLKQHRRWSLASDGFVELSLSPGANLFALDGPSARRTPLLETRYPTNISVADRETQAIPITLVNHSKQAQHFRLRASGFRFAGKTSCEGIIPARSTRALRGTYVAPESPRKPFTIGFTVVSDKRHEAHSIGVLTLSAVVVLLDLQGEKVAHLPQIGMAEIAARNRRNHPVSFHFTWSLNGKTVAEQSLSVAAHAGQTWRIPLRAEAHPPGKYLFALSIKGDEIAPIERTRDLLLLGLPGQKMPSAHIVLYGFERSTEEWFLPDWPDANKDAKGNVFRPVRSEDVSHEGKASLKTTLNLAMGRPSSGFLSVRPNFDWTPFRRASVDVYLPPNAPAGLTARFYMMGDGWRWREAARETSLTPGQWTTVQIALAGTEASTDWKRPEDDLRTALKNVMDIGVNIRNDSPSLPGYAGPIYLDNFQVETP